MSKSFEFDELPFPVRKEIAELLEHCNVSKAEIMKKFNEIWETNFIASAPTEVLRYIWTIGILCVEFSRLNPYAFNRFCAKMHSEENEGKLEVFE